MSRPVLAAVAVLALGVGEVPAPPPALAPPRTVAAGRADEPPAVELPSGVRIVDLETGEGAAARRGRRLTLHYRLSLGDGTAVADTRRRERPLSIRLGAGDVVAGLEEGLGGMRAGGRRRIEVPAEHGYGRRELPRIPPGSDLVFVVELLAVD